MVWIEFIISAGLIVLAGVRLVAYADALSEKLSLSKAWIGIILLGIVTSMPEAVSSLTAVVAFGDANLAIANMLGSTVFNVMIIVLLDALFREEAITNRIEPTRENRLLIFFAASLVLLVGFEMVLNQKVVLAHLWHVSFGTFLLMGWYFFGVHVLSKLKRNIFVDAPSQGQALGHISLLRINASLLFWAAIVIAASIRLTHTCEAIAYLTGWGQTFVGSTFLALVTSLPEIVVSVSAFRLGSLDMAVGNIFGSNMINMFIVGLCGLFYTKGPILSFVSSNQLLTIMLNVVLTGLVIFGMYFKKRKTILGIGMDSFLMVICFVVGLRFLYQLH